MASYALTSILLLTTYLRGTYAGRIQSAQCKAYPGTSDWPSTQKWNQLNATLGGSLLQPLAPAGACHPNQPNYNPEKCPEIQQEWKSYDWHAADPVSMMTDTWTNWTCLPDPEAPCSTAGYPTYVVNATTTAHVKSGVDFARENNIRLVIKGSGHDYLGRSNAPGSLSIWTHHLNSITFHKDSFELTGSDIVIQGNALTAGGSAQMYDLYKVAAEHNTTIVGGGGKSVTLGGYITGGGHGVMGPTYGLAADNVLQMEVVTPKGEILIANEAQNSDLFWALRGGGGSTFGVITSITIQAHPSPKLLQTFLIAGISANSTRRDEFLGFIMSQIPYLMNSGLRGYGFVSPEGHTPLPIPGLPPNMAIFAQTLMLPDKEPEALEAILEPLNETINSRFHGEAFLLNGQTTQYGSWLEWYNVNYDKGEAGGTIAMRSRLIDGKALTEDPLALARAVVSTAKPSGYILFYPVGGKGVNTAVPRGGSNAVNPGWRQAFVHSISTIPFEPFNKTAEQEAINKLKVAFKALDYLTPRIGAYLNEASAYETNPYTTFWGENYQRLKKIKRSIDPNDVLWCSPCVGNERWEELDDGRLCKKRLAYFRTDL